MVDDSHTAYTFATATIVEGLDGVSGARSVELRIQ